MKRSARLLPPEVPRASWPAAPTSWCRCAPARSQPGLIVDIKKIAEMTAIEETADGGFRIGAAVSGMALAEHPRFGKVWPGVLEAVNLIGSKQVQGRASAGGNLCNGSPAGDSVPAMVAAGAIVTVQGPNGRREIPVEEVPAGPGRTNLLPGEILVSFTCRRGRRVRAMLICA